MGKERSLAVECREIRKLKEDLCNQAEDNFTSQPQRKQQLATVCDVVVKPRSYTGATVDTDSIYGHQVTAKARKAGRSFSCTASSMSFLPPTKLGLIVHLERARATEAWGKV